MPLPHFLVLIAGVIVASGATIWAASAVGVPIFALAIVALLAAAIMHLGQHDRQDH